MPCPALPAPGSATQPAGVHAPAAPQVRAGVEERVKQAMLRAEQLEAELEAQHAQHAEQMQASRADNKAGGGGGGGGFGG